MADVIPEVETTDGYEKFLYEAADAVIEKWEDGDGKNPYTLDDLKQNIIRALENVFAGMR